MKAFSTFFSTTYLSVLILLLNLLPYTTSADQPPQPAPIPVQLNNPLEVGSIKELLVGILQIVMTLAIPIVVLFIIYAGFMYVTARGNAEQIKKATSALTYAVIGGVLIVGSLAIAEIVKNFADAF